MAKGTTGFAELFCHAESQESQGRVSNSGVCGLYIFGERTLEQTNHEFGCAGSKNFALP